MPREQETVWIEFPLVHQTPAALCVREEVHSTWVPKSQVLDFVKAHGKDRLEDFERNDVMKIEIPEWLAEKQELDDLVVDA